jgi:excisionase family DNA binding protein
MAGATSIGGHNNVSVSNPAPNPDTDAQPNGVVAEGQQIANILEHLVNLIESQSRSVIKAMPPVALSYKDAAHYIGVEEKTIRELVRTRKLPFVQSGSQRGRVILLKDLHDFLSKHRQAFD